MSAASPAEIAEAIKRQRFEVEVKLAQISGSGAEIQQARNSYAAARDRLTQAQEREVRALAQMRRVELRSEELWDQYSDLLASIEKLGSLLADATLGESVSAEAVTAAINLEVVREGIADAGVIA